MNVTAILMKLFRIIIICFCLVN